MPTCLGTYVPLSASFSDRARQSKRELYLCGPLACIEPPSLTINALTTDMLMVIDSDLPDFKITLAVSCTGHRGTEAIILALNLSV